MYGVYTVFLAGRSPNIRSYTVYIYGSGHNPTHVPSLQQTLARRLPARCMFALCYQALCPLSFLFVGACQWSGVLPFVMPRDGSYGILYRDIIPCSVICTYFTVLDRSKNLYDQFLITPVCVCNASAVLALSAHLCLVVPMFCVTGTSTAVCLVVPVCCVTGTSTAVCLVVPMFYVTGTSTAVCLVLS
jgi:hypothetical protein